MYFMLNTHTRDIDKRHRQLHMYTCYLVKISHIEIKLSKLSHFVANAIWHINKAYIFRKLNISTKVRDTM